MSTSPIFLFDGECVFCSEGVRWILACERGPDIHFVAAQSEAGQALLRDLDLPLTEWESNFLLETASDGTRVLHWKSEASLAVLRYMRWPLPWLRIFQILPTAWRDRLYDWIARNRYRWFGRRAVCMPPIPAHAHRFLKEWPACPTT